MVKSMTGFGRGRYEDAQRTITVEIKSVNHRYSEITVKMPRRYLFAEEAVKAIVKAKAPRGKIDVNVTVENTESSDEKVILNKALALEYYSALKELKDSIEVNGEPDLRMVALMPEVLSTGSKEEDEESFLGAISKATEQAADALDQMRKIEGAKLAEDILYRGELIEKIRSEIEVYAPNVAKLYTEKLKARIAELVGGSVDIPQDRILLEAAVFADKSNITEELVRLKSHGQQLKTIMAAEGEPAGKKLDFLVQEMNRESNTIGSKANDINITNNVLLLKAEIEKIREQVQNIE